MKISFIKNSICFIFLTGLLISTSTVCQAGKNVYFDKNGNKTYTAPEKEKIYKPKTGKKSIGVPLTTSNSKNSDLFYKKSGMYEK